MNSEKIFLAMNKVDDRLVADCDTFFTTKKIVGFNKKLIGQIATLAAVAVIVIFSGLCISHPAFAKEVPLVGNIFSKIGYKLGFGGEYESYAEPISSDESGQAAALTQTTDGTTVTLQDIYCDDK